MTRIFNYLLVIAVILTLMSCVTYTKKPIPPGMDNGYIKINTHPTKAKIFIDGVYYGTSPIQTNISWGEKKEINIVAEPIYPNQFPQNIYLPVPPVAKSMTIYMNVKPKQHFQPWERQREDSDTLDFKQEPQIIVEREIIEKNIAMILPVVFFDLDKDNIKDSEKPKLEEVAAIMNENNEYFLEIHGYADEIGNKDYNIDLSKRRADSVIGYLVNKGVKRNRLKMYIHGEQVVLDKNKKKLENKYARVVDFKIFSSKNVRKNVK